MKLTRSSLLAAMTALAVGISALTSIALSFEPAHATEICWTTVQVPWARFNAVAAPAESLASGLRLRDENDSLRTAVINTSDWDWDAFNIPGSSSGPVIVATVTLTA